MASNGFAPRFSGKPIGSAGHSLDPERNDLLGRVPRQASFGDMLTGVRVQAIELAPWFVTPKRASGRLAASVAKQWSVRSK